MHLLIKTKTMTNKDIPCLKLTDVAFILLMPTVVGILNFYEQENHTLSAPTSMILYLCNSD